MSATCSHCGEKWPRDPALDVPCPKCFAPLGSSCRRPSGHAGGWVGLHRERDQAALDAGVLQRCPAAPASTRLRAEAVSPQGQARLTV